MVNGLSLRGIINKAAGPDNIPDRVLKTCVDQLADVVFSSHSHKGLFTPVSQQPS